MRPGKRKSKHARRERHIDYMIWVKTLPCLARDAGGCTPDEDGHVEAAHVGDAVGRYGREDLDTVPLCSMHHRINGFDTYSGPFKGWSRLERFAWATKAITETRAAYKGR